MITPRKLYHRIAREGMGRALRHRQFRIYEASSWVSSAGMWVQRVAVGWLAWELTESGFWLGAVAAAEAAPILVFVPVAGAIADRFDRLALMRWVQIISLILAAALTAAGFAGLVNIYVLMVFVAASGTANAFNMPLRMAIAPNLVPKDDLASAIGVHSVLFNSTRFIGPALGGIIISVAGVNWAFAINAASYSIFIFGLFAIRLLTHEHSSASKTSLLADTLDGIKYVVRHPSIGPLLALTIVASIATRPFVDLFPGFADAVFGQGPKGLGTLFSAVGLGGIFGALWIANYGRVRGLVKIHLASLALTSALLIAFAATSSFLLAVAATAVLGFMVTVTTNVSQILIQNTVEGFIRGRVMGLYGLTHRAGPALGALLMGWASTNVGLRIPVIVGAVIGLIAVAVMLPRRARLAAGLEKTAD